MKACKIMRGFPGSGKSTLARAMAWSAVAKGYRAAIVSADLYFIRPDGRYSWKGDELIHAHDWAREELQKAVNKGTDLVIVDNCNMKHSDYGSYAAIANGYDINLEVVGMPATEADMILYATRNVHGVPLQAIQRMAAKWEP